MSAKAGQGKSWVEKIAVGKAPKTDGFGQVQARILRLGVLVRAGGGEEGRQNGENRREDAKREGEKPTLGV